MSSDKKRKRATHIVNRLGNPTFSNLIHATTYTEKFDFWIPTTWYQKVLLIQNKGKDIFARRIMFPYSLRWLIWLYIPAHDRSVWMSNVYDEFLIIHQIFLPADTKNWPIGLYLKALLTVNHWLSILAINHKYSYFAIPAADGHVDLALTHSFHFYIWYWVGKLVVHVFFVFVEKIGWFACLLKILPKL